MTKGRFITFEGGEGTGKSTQINLLSEQLQKQGIKTILTREPGGTPSAEAIRALLVTGSIDKFSPQTEALLNYAARAEHLRKVIKPGINANKWVLCDRFNDSTYAYQGGEVSQALLDSLDTAIVGDCQPDLTFILNIDPKTGLKRAEKRLKETEDGGNSEDRFEKKGIEYHRGIRDRFLRRASRDTERYIVIEADKKIEEIADEIWGHILNLFLNKII